MVQEDARCLRAAVLCGVHQRSAEVLRIRTSGPHDFVINRMLSLTSNPVGSMRLVLLLVGAGGGEEGCFLR